MLVRCKHYSVTFPTGMQNVGDVFDIPKAQAEYYQKIDWIEILPKELQPEVKRGKKKKNEIKSAVDLSKSKKVGKYSEHIFNK